MAYLYSKLLQRKVLLSLFGIEFCAIDYWKRNAHDRMDIPAIIVSGPVMPMTRKTGNMHSMIVIQYIQFDLGFLENEERDQDDSAACCPLGTVECQDQGIARRDHWIKLRILLGSRLLVKSMIVFCDHSGN